MVQAKETRKNKSIVWVELKNRCIQVAPIKGQRNHIPLAERMAKALEDGTWDGKPYEITQEDSDWLDMPSVGEEIPW